MRLIAARQYLRRLSARLHARDATACEHLLGDCDRALAAVEAALAEPCDADIVQRQLLESVIVDVHRTTQQHPWGSTTAGERLVETELKRDTLEIPIETDNLPHFVTAAWTDHCASLDLEFHLVRLGQTRWRSKTAVYSAQVKAIRTTPDAICHSR